MVSANSADPRDAEIHQRFARDDTSRESGRAIRACGAPIRYQSFAVDAFRLVVTGIFRSVLREDIYR